MRVTIKEYMKIQSEQGMGMENTPSEIELERALKSKNNGAKCISCGNKIWALGTATVGYNTCFSCLTGQTDSSEDYEITN